jgi:hypothetical protein
MAKKRFYVVWDGVTPGVYADWKSGKITAKRAMELTDTKRTSFYKLAKKSQ